MGKKRDYTRYSKELNDSVESIEDKVPENSIESTTEVIRMMDTIAESEAKDAKIEVPKFVDGIVTDCVRLNVREDPSPTSTILGTITADAEVIVNKEESTEEYYKICTSIGLEGYCMKKFVTIML